MRSVPNRVPARRNAVGEGVGLVLHEQVIVFDRSRPVRRKTVFDAGADRATPAGVGDGVVDLNVGSCREGAVAIRSHGSAALQVEQSVVGGKADLTGEQAERLTRDSL